MTLSNALVFAGLALLAFIGVVGGWLLINDPSGRRKERHSRERIRSAREQTDRRQVHKSGPAEEYTSVSGESRRTWNPYSARSRQGGAETAEYRWKPGARERAESSWNPFDERQSMRSRVRANRRRAVRARAEFNYYRLLGLEPGATDEEIVRAYRRHAATIHPDRFYDDPERRRQAEEKLKQLNKVMEILRDPIARARYDAQL